jgi:hypothetical protein
MRTLNLLYGRKKSLMQWQRAHAGVVELITYGLTINPKCSASVASKPTVVTALLSLYLGAEAMGLCRQTGVA